MALELFVSRIWGMGFAKWNLDGLWNYEGKAMHFGE
jgi:hypothetical protein